MQTRRLPSLRLPSISTLAFLGPALALSVALASPAWSQTGACCSSCTLPECTITTPALCDELGGSYLGDGTTCEGCEEIVFVPEPAASTVEPADALDGLFVCPSAPAAIPASVITVTARDNCDRLIPGAAITVELGAGNPLCGGMPLFGSTNGEGEAIVVLAASGCVGGVPLAGVVRANGVTIRAYTNVKSPDSDGNGRVELGDLVAFSNEFLGSVGDLCHDYDNNGATALPDLVLFSPAFVAGNECP